MIENSFSLEQARASCRDHQYLVGNEYDEHGLVAAVVVCPLDPLNKWIFNTYYAETKNAKKALEFYFGPYYDVMVISENTMKNSDLRSFLRQKNIKFDAGKY